MNKALERARQIAGQFRKTAGPRPLARAKEAAGELYIYEMIGGNFWGEGLTAKSVTEALDKMKGVSNLNVYINSEGGDVFEGKAIYNALKRFEATKTVYIDGIAASAATLIAMSGDKIITAANATWMIHEVWTLAMGNASELRAAADVLEKENEALAGTYVTRTKNTLEQVKEWMAAETWMSAQEALDRGFTDEITEQEQEDEEEQVAASLRRPLIAAYNHPPDKLMGKRASNAARLAALDVSIMQRRASPASQRTGQPGASKAK